MNADQVFGPNGKEIRREAGIGTAKPFRVYPVYTFLECRANPKAARKGEIMDRKQFLKKTCEIGVCGCALSFLTPQKSLLAEEVTPSDRKLEFARYILAKMVGFMADGTEKSDWAGLLEKTGRECSKLYQNSPQFKGKPDEYLIAIKKAWGTESLWDKEKGIITLTGPETECGCPLVDKKLTPVFWCNCSVGFQKETFETIFGKPVQVILKESKLRGGKRCIVDVQLT